MKTVALPAGERVPAFGMGTWRVGERAALRAEEIATLRLGIELGATLIDTAEMYGEGQAESLIGEAIEGRRDQVFLVSKVYPHNATRRGAVAACERSLGRLKTDRLDLYLLHWRGSVPLAETVEGFEALRKAGKIRHWGISNLDLADMQELWSAPNSQTAGQAAQTDQLLYNLVRRGIEWDLLPWLRERHVPVMAYSPLDEGRLLRHPKLADFARRRGVSVSQAALAWLLAKDDVIVIPKTSSRERLRDNLGALDHPLDAAALAELDRIFPPPDGPRPLEMI
jgi:diketogulonate reductase-like aldo/keto reductase